MTALSDFVSGIVGVDLASVPTINDVTITNTGGDNAVILDANAIRAGVMTTTQVDKLTNIEPGANLYVHPTYPGDDFNIDTGNLTGAQVVSRIDINLTTDNLGHVTDANALETVRTLTLANLGYTGDSDANKYIHPTHAGDDFNVDTTTLTGAWVVSRVTMNMSSDGEGHVTDANGIVAARQLTAGNLDAYTKGEVDDLLVGYPEVEISAGVFTPAFTGGTTNGTTSGTCIWVRVGGMITVFGRITWTTPPSGSGQIRITGLPFTNDYTTGFSFPSKRLENNSNDANGHGASLSQGSNQIYLWDNRASGENQSCPGNNFNSSGWIDINFSFFTSTPTP